MPKYMRLCVYAVVASVPSVLSFGCEQFFSCQSTTKSMGELVWGIKNGDLDQVRDIVENKNIDVNQMIDGRTPLHYAADYGQSEVLRYLLDKGADANATDKHGITTLLAAIWEGHTNCVKLLLEKGAKPNGLTPDGTSYLDAAEKDEIKELLKAH